jgi:hypothetical protein
VICYTDMPFIDSVVLYRRAFYRELCVIQTGSLDSVMFYTHVPYKIGFVVLTSAAQQHHDSNEQILSRKLQTYLDPNSSSNKNQDSHSGELYLLIQSNLS